MPAQLVAAESRIADFTGSIAREQENIPSVVEMVERRLRESSYYYLRAVSCSFEDGVLTFRGRVPSFYLKQTLQALAEKVDGVVQVVNLVDVTSPRGAS